MENILEYKGYTGTIEYSEEDNLLYGKLLGIRSLVLYEGETVDQLIHDFHEAVDDYLDLCDSEYIIPEKP